MQHDRDRSIKKFCILINIDVESNETDKMYIQTIKRGRRRGGGKGEAGRNVFNISICFLQWHALRGKIEM